MKILELFCGLGGWSKGFHDIFPDAEFYGVDIKDYGYPYNFIKADLTTGSQTRSMILFWPLLHVVSFQISKEYQDIIIIQRELD